MSVSAWGAAGRKRQNWIGPIKCLNRRLLINAKHRTCCGGFKYSRIISAASFRAYSISNEAVNEGLTSHDRDPMTTLTLWIQTACTSVWVVAGIDESTIQFLSPGALIRAPHPLSEKSR